MPARWQQAHAGEQREFTNATLLGVRHNGVPVSRPANPPALCSQQVDRAAQRLRLQKLTDISGVVVLSVSLRYRYQQAAEGL